MAALQALQAVSTTGGARRAHAFAGAVRPIGGGASRAGRDPLK